MREGEREGEREAERRTERERAQKESGGGTRGERKQDNGLIATPRHAVHPGVQDPSRTAGA